VLAVKSVLKKKKNKPHRLEKLLLIHRRQGDVFRNCSQHTSVLHARFVPMAMSKAKGDTSRLIKKKIMGRKTARVNPSKR